jgi:hypothetical protein
MNFEQLAKKYNLSFDQLENLLVDLNGAIDNPDIRISAVSTLIRDGYTFKGGMHWEKQIAEPVRLAPQGAKDPFGADPTDGFEPRQNTFL